MKLRIATCTQLPEPDADEALLLRLLSDRGIDAMLQAWDDPKADWQSTVPTLLRSPWNYHHHVARFLTWAETVERTAPLWNPTSLIRWNADKTYLADLAHAGIAIVPTVYVQENNRRTLEEIVEVQGWQELVIKPTVSAGSFETLRCRRENLAAGEAHLDRLLPHRDMMVQRYMPSVETYGERSLLWLGGEFTHAIRKSPRFLGDQESVTGPMPIRLEEQALAERLVSYCQAKGELLYARCDMVPDNTGTPHLMELELIEPSLFLSQGGPRAQQQFVEAIAARLC